MPRSGAQPAPSTTSVAGRSARYDKQHLFDVNLVESNERFIESESIEPGDRVIVIDSPVGRLGISVCYDLRFPELYRAMADRGVEVITLPAAFTEITGRAHWETLVRARAIENLSYIIAAGAGRLPYRQSPDLRPQHDRRPLGQ
jgi:predicted amidohydrolase